MNIKEERERNNDKLIQMRRDINAIERDRKGEMDKDTYIKRKGDMHKIITPSLFLSRLSHFFLSLN